MTKSKKTLLLESVIELIDFASNKACKERDDAVRNVKGVFPKQDVHYGYAMGMHAGLNRALSFFHFLKEMLKKVKGYD